MLYAVGRAAELDSHLLANHDNELTTIKNDGYRTAASSENARNRSAGRASAARGGLPHAALEDPRADPPIGERRPPTDVGSPREARVVLNEWPDLITLAMAPGWCKTELGGEGAQIEPEDSVRAQLKTFEALNASHNGQFIDRFGTTVAW